MPVPGWTVLLADDDVLTHWTTAEVLAMAGFNVVSACRAAEVLRLMRTQAEFDLLLADLDLMGEVGDLALDRWRAKCPGRPVIYTGLHRSPAIAVLEQHEHFIAKPFGAAKLLRTVNAAMEEASFRPLLPVLRRRSHHVH